MDLAHDASPSEFSTATAGGPALARRRRPCLESVTVPGDGVRLTARLVAWAIGALLALAYGFRRVELGR